MPLHLQFKGGVSVPVEVEGILPERLAGLALDAVERLPVFLGNERTALGELFTLSGSTEDERLVFSGDLSGVHWIGAQLTRGSVEVRGSAGRHVGSQMLGGSIEVHGDAGDWVGAELRGGSIHIHGNAGHLIAAAYRGSARGMTGGTVLVDGDVGNEIGHTMRRGCLVVGGSAGDLIGFNMLAGTILVFGNCGIRHGAGMRRGTIGLLGNPEYQPLPTFRPACRRPFEFLRLLEPFLASRGFPLTQPLADRVYELYHGDLLEGGRGELLLPRDN